VAHEDARQIGDLVEVAVEHGGVEVTDRKSLRLGAAKCAWLRPVSGQ